MSLTINQRILLNNAVRYAIRDFFLSHKYTEVDSPLLVPAVIPESYLEPFETTLTSPSLPSKHGYLIASPEAYMKRLLCLGLDRSIFYLGKAFRNDEPIGRLHNHEFTLLEWYQLGGDYKTLMKETEKLVKYVYKKITNNKLQITNKLQIPNHKFRCITFGEAVAEFVPAVERSENNDISPDSYSRIVTQYIEPHLGFDVPTFLTHFPAWTSPLAKLQTTNIKKQIVAERFELYIRGIELVNGWTELTDVMRQKENLENEIEIRKDWGKPMVKPDTEFIEALESGMPPCAGAALGVDRLAMVLCGASSLGEVLPFTTKELFY